MNRKKVAIIGAGIAGLHLAYGLSQHDFFEISVFSAKTPGEIYNGRMLTTQVHFPEMLKREKRFNIPDYGETYKIDQLNLYMAGQKILTGNMDEFVVSIDQRMYIPELLDGLEQKGVQVIYGKIQKDELPFMVRDYDVIVDCTGKTGPMTSFSVDESLSPLERPMRTCSAGFFKGIKTDVEHSFNFRIIPGQGELFETSIMTRYGIARSFLLETVPGSEMDLVKGIKDHTQFEEKMKEVLARFFPDVYERIDHEEFGLIEPSSYVNLAITPVIRTPYQMMQGKLVIGCGDSVILNDPVTGQGANTTSYCAEALYLTLLQEKDRDWDEQTGLNYWNRIKDYVTCVTEWTNAMMGPVPEEFAVKLIELGADQEKADHFASLFKKPQEMHRFMFGM